MRYWLFNNDGKASGPYELDQIRTLVAQGAVAPTAQLCAEGQQQWMPLAAVLNAPPGGPGAASAAPPNAPPTSPVPVAGLPGRCACCGAVPITKPKPLYGLMVCSKCYYAFANRRQFAFVIDIVLIWIARFAVGMAVYVIVGTDLQPDPERLVGLLLSLVFVALLLLKDGFAGYSPGKFLCGVRAIDARSGKPIGPLQSMGRNLLLLIPFAVFVAAYQLLRGPRMGDGIARTKVIWRKYPDAPVFLSSSQALQAMSGGNRPVG